MRQDALPEGGQAQTPRIPHIVQGVEMGRLGNPGLAQRLIELVVCSQTANPVPKSYAPPGESLIQAFWSKKSANAGI